MKEVRNLHTNNLISNKAQNQETWAELYNTLQELLDRRHALLAQVQEFKQIDLALKNYFSGINTCSIGTYKVSGHEVEEETLYLPAHIKNKYLRKNKKWEIEISKI